jgi:peptide/nickel transport system permease protein
MGAQLPDAEAGGATATLAVAPTVAQPGARRRGWTRNLDIIVPAALVGLLLFLCFIWPLFGTVPPPTGGDILDANAPSFSEGHFLGADQIGNDLWSRLLYGGRNSLEIAFAVNLIGLVVGGLLGAFAAFWGSFTDTVIMRVLDVLIAFPSLVLALAIAQSLGASKLHTIYALSFFSVPAFARLARASTLRLRERPLMLAARLAGTRAPRMLLRHVAPNILPQLATFGLLGIGVTIILEGALSFLGLGVPPPNPSWGNMIFEGQAVMSAEPKLVLLPSAFLFVTVLSFNMLGDALRSRWNVS